MALVLSCALVACNKADGKDPSDKDLIEPTKKEFTITFDTQGGSEVKSITIAEGETITMPSNPTKEGYVFDGWYLSDEFIEKFNATQTISSDITVYAKWKEDYYSKGLNYELINDKREYAVTGKGGCTDNDIVIPSEYNSKPVTSIGYDAFNGCTGLTSVTIPNSVTYIGGYAFNGCTGLTSVTIGNGVTSIAGYAFYECTRLTSITIPDSVTSIGFKAFNGCTGLTRVTVGSGVTSIGDYAFQNCTGLTSIYYTGDVAGWCGISGLDNLMGYSKTLYIGGNKVEGELTIPDSVTSIGRSAFYGCKDLTSITIPDSVTSIGSWAFNGCSNLTKIVGSSSVVSVIAQQCGSE